MTDFTGTILRVDLEKEKTERFTLDESDLRKFIGGTGLGAKILYDEVSPETGWSDPENRLIFAAGPLNATPIGGSGSVSVVSKGPLTNGAGCSQANGYFGSYLRLCGLTAIIVQGRAQGLKYLYVDSESEEIRDAEWLADIDTYKTADLIRHEHGCKRREMSVASIGPAGENLVKFAGIFFDYGHSASHNGLGAVMGSKNLRAIAVARGERKVQMKDPDKVRKIAKKLIENVKEQSQAIYEYGTLNAIHANAEKNMIPVKNYTTSNWEIDEEKWGKFTGPYIRKRFAVRKDSCWACQINHCYVMRITEGPYADEELEEPEYEQFVAWSSAIGQDDVTATMMLEDSLVTCRFNTRMNVKLLCQAVSAVTGWCFSYEEGMNVGRRIAHLLRAFNVRHGVSGRRLDRPSPRYGSKPDAGPGKGKSLIDVWDKMLDAYYEGMGWDSDGKPLPETLERYGLDYVARDLWLQK